MTSLWNELKRRNVVRVVVAYAVGAWLVLQLTDVLTSLLKLPTWVGGFVFVLIIVGFFLALFLSWAFELTPDGVKREKDVDRSRSITGATGRKLDFVIIAVLGAAVVVFAMDKFLWSDADGPTTQTGPTTIAVLPFTNMSDSQDQEYFSDGLTEELLNLLAKIPELQVTSRTSAFFFKDKEFTIADVGEQLNVDHVLEGSVRRSGDTIRVTAQLIEVATDAHIWSETWDREFADVFAIQDEIAGHVVDALKVELLDELPRVSETSPEAYSLYLRARVLGSQANAEAAAQAEVMIERVLELDPQYVPAWNSLATVRYFGMFIGVRQPADAVPLVREAIEEALRLDTDNVGARIAMARVAMAFEYDFAKARKLFNESLKLAPRNSAVYALGARLELQTGHFEKAVQFAEKAHELDPLANHKPRQVWAYLKSGRVEEAMRYFEQRAFNAPFGDAVHAGWARGVAWLGDYERALEILENEASDGHQVSTRAMIYWSMGDVQHARDDLELLLTLGERWTYETAAVYAHFGEADEAFRWLEQAIARRDGSLRQIVGDPYFDKIREDPRFDDVLKRLGRGSAN